MCFWTRALMAGLAASAAANTGEVESFALLTINVTAHLVATSSGKHLSQEALEGQMDIINRSFAPHNITFVLVETERVVDPLWSIDIDGIRMMWDNNRGDARTLNLYFVERFDANSTQLGLPYAPQRLPLDLGAYRVDGAVIASYTVPGGLGWKAATWEGKAAVRVIGHWLGLLDPSIGGCEGKGDLVDDTPAATGNASLGICPKGLDSCPDQPGLDPIHNFMSATTDSCKTEFTPGQGRRMHQLWNRFRAPHRAPTRPLLAPIAPLEGEGKLPYYSRPVSMMAALVECLPHEANVTREAREAYCSTFIYCYFDTWRAADTGEKYTSNNTWVECEDARVAPQTDEEAGVANSESMPARVSARRVERRWWPLAGEEMFDLWMYGGEGAIPF
ncbi:pregnancy-associated plasma protein-A domain-containing protein [Hirsutella rhossiliensis]|uniref:Pregnancy-associated plasma protein-A domain-containing protein n=1 Tax=Hirsutella rhossiliensis TaxID=111463 RepID=A0A9P8MPV4_9HYPO|nr:pregnancy-associated plasma protein-A domain-containing protein [Hirsutella rhossiliensis]KAH0959040.1 pregnancy-associated plasma protein-A domain-containing protein [Hirsutella rhossiliensis]